MQGIMIDEEAKQQNKTKLELIAFQFLSYKSISERGYYFFFHLLTGWPIVRGTLETLEKSRNEFSGQWNSEKIRKCFRYILGVRE